MSESWLITLTCIHIAFCCAAYMLIKRGIIHVSYAYIIIVLLIPIFGLASMIGIEIAASKRPSIKQVQALDTDGSLRHTIVKEDDDGSAGAVPLEEVLLMNDMKTRRAIMMDVLHNDPVRYITQLKTARLNSDMEVAHYATTTIMEIQREFDTSLQQLEQLLAQENNSSAVLDQAIELISRYIGSGLLEGFTLKRMRERYHDLLTQKISLQPRDRKAWLALFQNNIDLDDFTGAEECFIHMAEKWPNVEEMWLLALRLAVERQDKHRLNDWSRKIAQVPVRLSAQGQETVKFWTELEKNPAGDPAQSVQRFQL